MPFIYTGRELVEDPNDKLTGKDLGVTLDIGGKFKEKLTREDDMAKRFGVAIQDTVQTGVNLATKLPGLEPAAKMVADSPIGWLGGKVLDVLNVPSYLVQQVAARARMMDAKSLPQDVQNMLNSGASIDEVAEYMYNTGRAFSNDTAANLFWQVVLDPLNFTPLALGKVNLLKNAGKIASVLGGAAVGGAPGAIVGGVAAWKGAQIAAKIPGAAKAGEAVAASMKGGNLEKILTSLNKPVGANLGTRIPAGARNIAKLDELDKEAELRKAELAKSGPDPIIESRIKELELERRTTMDAMEVGKDVTNGFALGVYRGIVGSKSAMAGGLKAIGAAMSVPVVQTLPYKLGGKAFNYTIDRVKAALPVELRSQVDEMFGRGGSNIAIIAASKLLAAPEMNMAKSIADATLTQYYDALKVLEAEAGVGAKIDFTTDNIAEVMIRRVKTPGADGADAIGTNRALRISDTPEGIAELKERIEVIRNSKGGARTALKSSAQIEALSLHIQNALVTNKLQSFGTAERASQAVGDIIREMGPDGLAKLVSEEVDKLVYEMAPKLRNKTAAYEMYRERIRSIRAAASDGSKAAADDLDDARIRQSFEDTFGQYYDESGSLKENIKRGGLREESHEGAARAMVAVDMASFASANKSAARVNKLLREVLTEDPQKLEQLIAKHGQEAVMQMREYARMFIGGGSNGITLVKDSFLFGSIARGFASAYDAIDQVDAELRQTVSSSAEVRSVTGQLMPHQYVGNKTHVDRVTMLIKNIAQKAWSAGDKRASTKLMKMARKMRTAEDMNDVRQIWKESVLGSSEDLGTIFNTRTDASRIQKYLKQAIESGFASTDMSAAEKSALFKFVEMSGLDPRIIRMFSGVEGSGRYVAIKAPNVPWSRSSAILRNPNVDDATKAFIYESRVVPFIDMTSPALDDIAPMATNYTASRLQELYTHWFRPFGTSATTGNIKNRLAVFLSRGGITSGQIDAIMDEIVRAAMDDGVSARGIAPNKIESAFQKAFDEYGGVGAYDMFKQNYVDNMASKGEFDSQRAIMFAFEGNANVVGYTQKLTGRAKVIMPSLAKLTDDIYPNIRFKMNPLYWIQEWLESPTLNRMRGINDEVLKVLTKEGRSVEISANRIRDLSAVGPEAHSIVDNVSFLTVFRNSALQSALDTNWGLNRKLPLGKTFGEKLSLRKEASREAAAMNIAARNFYDTLAQKDPQLLNALISHYKTSDSVELFVRYVDMRDRLRNTERVLSDIEASRPANTGFRRLPDKRGEVIDEFRFNVVGGMDQSGLIQNAEDIFQFYVNSPRQAAAELSAQLERMKDAGYDVSIIDPAISAVRSALFRIDDIKRGNTRAFSVALGAEEEKAIESLRQAKGELSRAVERLSAYSDEAAMRTYVAKVMMLETPFAVGGQISYEGGRIAEALALGHSYSSEIADVASSLQRIVESSKIRLQAEFGPGVRLNLRQKVDNVRQKARMYEILAEEARKAAGSLDTIEALSSASYSLLTNHGAEEQLYRAFEHVYEKALKEANKITYFDPERTVFERTINHPFLGFYPYSYMFKKILPELINFLFKKPFGMNAPGAGFQAYMHARDYFENQMETDYTFRKFMEDNSEVAFMVTQLFPGVPWDISALPPAYVRKIATSLAGRDKDYTLSDIIGRDIIGTTGKMGPLTSIPSFVGAGQQIIDQLTGANQPKLPEYQIKPDKDYFNIGG